MLLPGAIAVDFFTRNQRIDWQTDEPGHFEVDLVHHCGPNTGGMYVYSLQMVDIATGWGEPTAIYDCSFLAMKDGFDHLFARLPFNVIELHPDNGSEFINQLLYRYWHSLVPNLQVSRTNSCARRSTPTQQNWHDVDVQFIRKSCLDALPINSEFLLLTESILILHDEP